MAKILHIITRLDMGGSAIETLLACQKLSKKHSIVLVHGLSLESKMNDTEERTVQKAVLKAKKLGVRFVAVPSLIRRIHPIKDTIALFAILKVLSKEKPALVHTHTSKAGVLGRLSAKIARVPIVIHKPHGHVFFGHFGAVKSRLFLWIEKIFAHGTDRIIALTEGEKQDYIKYRVGRPDKMIKIHSGVDVHRYMRHKADVIGEKQNLGLQPNGFMIGFIGWLLPIKGPMHLLNAVSKVWLYHPDVNLVFVGKGDLDVDLRARALEINAGARVKFLGWRDDIENIMQIFDLLALPSLNEGMGRVVVEAMASGKPVVASNVGGIPDLVQHGKTGFLVPPADENALTEAIVKLIRNPEQAKKMGVKGRLRSHRFSLAAMIEKLDAVYEDLIFSHAKPLKHQFGLLENHGANCTRPPELQPSKNVTSGSPLIQKAKIEDKKVKPS